MSLALFFAQHVSNASIFIFRSLRMCVVVLLWFDVCWCYGVVRLGCCGILMQAEALQNYFIFQEQIYRTDKGIAMCSPISGTIAEIFLQYLEHTHIRPLIQTKHILFYTRYIDNILIIYDTETTDHDYLTQYTNTMHTNLQSKSSAPACIRIPHHPSRTTP